MIWNQLKRLRNSFIAYGNAKIIEAVKNGHAKKVRFLLTLGVNPNVKESSGVTLLMLACAKSHLEIISLLLDHKASLYEKDNDGWTACKWAYFKNDHDVIALLKHYTKLHPFYNEGDSKINVLGDALLVINAIKCDALYQR